VMFDPSPAVDLSLGEYVELYNRSEKTFLLDGWKVCSGEREYSVGEQGAELPSGGYFLVRDITLPNSGTLLALYNEKENPVHAVSYRIPFDAPEWKKDGGWSLEAPDPDRVCNISESWEYSRDPSGGTPGRINSCDGDRPDAEPPVFLFPGFGDNGILHLYFSERVELPEDLYRQVRLQPGNRTADSISRNEPLGEQVNCYFSRDLSVLPGFTVSLPALRDCAENRGPEVDVRGGAVVPPEEGSVLISEVMYDPEEGFPEFIEFYHPGPGFADLQDLMIGVAAAGGSPEKYVPISSHSRLIAPGAPVVLTRDERYLRTAYNLERSGTWAEVPDLPLPPRSGGWIFLADRMGNPVDVAACGDDMHLDLVRDSKGISLERIDFEKPGTDASAWNSAGSLEGYCTPGGVYARKGGSGPFPDLLRLEPRVISPDNDGYHDLLEITISPGEAGALVRIWITGTDGTPVMVLANNRISGPESSCSWNGEDNGGHMVAEGFYVVHAKVYYPSTGRSKADRGVVGLVYK
jgi:hypothetical protein